MNLPFALLITLLTFPLFSQAPKEPEPLSPVQKFTHPRIEQLKFPLKLDSRYGLCDGGGKRCNGALQALAPIQVPGFRELRPLMLRVTGREKVTCAAARIFVPREIYMPQASPRESGMRTAAHDMGLNSCEALPSTKVTDQR
jgi:hypothetical protein